jgi:hypothetical protein
LGTLTVETLKRIGDKYIKEGQRERKKDIKEKGQKDTTIIKGDSQINT